MAFIVPCNHNASIRRGLATRSQSNMKARTSIIVKQLRDSKVPLLLRASCGGTAAIRTQWNKGPQPCILGYVTDNPQEGCGAVNAFCLLASRLLFTVAPVDIPGQARASLPGRASLKAPHEGRIGRVKSAISAGLFGPQMPLSQCSVSKLRCLILGSFESLGGTGETSVPPEHQCPSV